MSVCLSVCAQDKACQKVIDEFEPNYVERYRPRGLSIDGGLNSYECFLVSTLNYYFRGRLDSVIARLSFLGVARGRSLGALLL